MKTFLNRRSILSRVHFVFASSLLCVAFLSAEVTLPGVSTMGGANTASLRTPQAASVSPASLSLIDGSLINLFYALPTGRTESLLDTSYLWAGYAMKLPGKRNSALGFSFISEIENNLDGRDELGKKLGSFSAMKQSLDVAYSRVLFRSFAVGVKNNFSYHQIGDFRKTAYSAGIGLHYEVQNALRFSLNVDNLVRTKSTFIGSQYFEPVVLNVGASFSPSKSLMFVTSLEYTSAGDISAYAGGLYQFRNGLGLSVNYNNGGESRFLAVENKGTLYENKTTESLLFREMGFGVNYDLKSTTIEYSFRYHGDLGFTHCAGLSYKLK